MTDPSHCEKRDMPTISVVIPVHPERTTCDSIEALEAVDYPASKLEVILAKGSRPSAQRNRAAEQAQGEVLCFLDDDSVPAVGLFHRVSRHLQDDNVKAVGGPSLAPSPRNLLERATGLVLSSRFGTYRVKARYSSDGDMREARETDIILCNLFMKRSFFVECGGFDERLYPNEENELLQRIRQLHPGASIRYDPDAHVFRPPPRSFGAYARKIFGYGRGRMLQTLVRPDPGSVVFLLPLFLVAYFSGLPVLVWKLGTSAFVPIVLYLLIDVLASLKHSIAGRRPSLFPVLLMLYPLTHLAYGTGLLFEIPTFAFRRRRSSSSSVKIVRKQSLGCP